MEKQLLTKVDLIAKKKEIIKTIQALAADYTTLVNENKGVLHTSALVIMNLEEDGTIDNEKLGTQVFEADTTMVIKSTDRGLDAMLDHLFSGSPELFKVFEGAVINHLDKTFKPSQNGPQKN